MYPRTICVNVRTSISDNTDRKINAIKVVRQVFGLGLKQSKDLVEGTIPFVVLETQLTDLIMVLTAMRARIRINDIWSEEHTAVDLRGLDLPTSQDVFNALVTHPLPTHHALGDINNAQEAVL